MNKKSCIIAMLKFSQKGGSAARTLHGLFLCPDMIPAAQPRALVVMANASPFEDFSNGKWAAVFHACTLKNSKK